jgi:spermidine/putrescine-binding protein
MFKWTLLASAIILCSVSAFTAVATPSPQIVNVANWNDYIDVSLIEAFTKETGIHVNYETYDSDEGALQAFKSGKYDVVTPSLTLLKEMIKGGYATSFDTSKLSGYRDVQSILMARLRTQDRDGNYAVPYMWGRIGLLVNKPKVEAILGHKLKHSWDLVFDLETVKKLSSCGVMMMDSPLDLAAIFNHYKGNTIDQITTRKADKFLTAIAELSPYYQTIDSAIYIDTVAANDTCVAVAFEGDGRTAMANNPDHVYFMPSEGTVIFMDSLVVTSDTKNKEAAVKFIDFMTRTDNAIVNANFTGYNPPTYKVMETLIKEDPSKEISFSEGTMFVQAPFADGLATTMTEKWLALVATKAEEYALAKAAKEQRPTAAYDSPKMAAPISTGAQKKI